MVNISLFTKYLTIIQEEDFNKEEFFDAGRSKDFNVKFDSKELKKGIEVEKEHTTSQGIAERIAKDHMSKLSDYYTRLKNMEEDAKEINKDEDYE